MEILGIIDLDIYVEKLSKTIALTFFVVPDTVMNVSSMLGRDYFNKADLTLTYKSSNNDVAETFIGGNEL